MNERIRELIKQLDLRDNDIDLERFSELIRLDETKACAKHYLEIMRDAVEQAVLKEREANAKFFDLNDTAMFWGSQVAQAIRQRGDSK